MRAFYRTACILSLATATAAQAQQGGASSASTDLSTPASPGSAAEPTGQIQEIVVTAQRRAERLQDVPLAVTALTADKLSESGIATSQDLMIVTPGLTEPETAGYSQPHIRGVGSSTNGPGLEQPVATYVDGVYIAAATAAMMSLNNIDRVEVLKGPQGTLFGRNSTGGLIQIVTKDPSSVPSGDVSLSYGNYNDVVANAYLAGPIADKLNGDVAVRYETQPQGWGRNLDTGRYAYNLPHDVTARVKLLFEPSDTTQVRLTADYDDRVSTLNALQLDLGYPTRPSFENNLFGPFPQGGRYDINQNVNSDDSLQSGGIALHVTQLLESVSLQSITAYRDSASGLPLDADLTPVNLIDISGTAHDSQFTQELQVSSAAPSKFKWTAGVFYYHALDRWDPYYVDIEPPFAPAPLSLGTVASEYTNSEAGYAQGTYSVWSDTNLTLGGRYTYEHKSISGVNSTYVSGIDVGDTPIPTPGTPAALVFRRFNYRVALDHEFTQDVMGYLSYNTGFKSGGFNLDVPTQAPYLPEDIRAYEAGVKTELFDRKARLNAEGYYYNYKNIQVGKYVDENETLVNGAGAHIYGVDLDGEVTVWRGFNLSGGAAYNHARFTSFPEADYIAPVNGMTVPANGFLVASAAGKTLPYAPACTFDLAADYKIPLDGGTLEANVTGFYTSQYYGAPDNVSSQAGYALVNLFLGWTLPDGKWSLRAWVKNLGNAYYATTFIEANDHVARVDGAPRTYGLTFDYRF